MSRSSPRVFSREFKLQVVGRMLAGENVSALSRELKVLRKDLCVWRDRFRSGGAEALRGRGRPRKGEAVASAASGKIAKRSGAAARELKASRRRVAELERKIGQQQLELDFFRQALRQVKDACRPSDGPGVLGSIRSSKR
jgi:transposase